MTLSLLIHHVDGFLLCLSDTKSSYSSRRCFMSLGAPMLEFEFVLGSSTILSLDHTDVRARKERMVYFKQALPRWIAGNHTFYFGRLAQLLSARYRCGRSGVRFPDRSNRHSVATVATFVRSCVAQALSRGDGPRHSLHASAKYGEYNEDLIFCATLSLYT